MKKRKKEKETFALKVVIQYVDEGKQKEVKNLIEYFQYISSDLEAQER